MNIRREKRIQERKKDKKERKKEKSTRQEGNSRNKLSNRKIRPFVVLIVLVEAYE